MRLSLLLQREPIGQILEQTLARYWTHRYGEPYAVRWHPRRPNAAALRQNGEQTWLGNIYLNAIFVPDVHRAALEPTLLEFSRSTVAWRRPLQATYVAFATTSWGAPLLAQVGLSVKPPIPAAADQVIIAGNHKIRILDERVGLAYSILKFGAEPRFFRQEIETREAARQAGVPMPAVREVGTDGTWFSEEYVCGTPLNRLADPQAAQRAEAQAMQALDVFMQRSCTEQDLEGYLSPLQAEIMQLAQSAPHLSTVGRQAILDLTAQLAGLVLKLQPAGGGRIATGLTHGDFQPGNILSADGHIWIIDWEYAGRRQAAYDWLVFGLRSRFPEGLAERLDRFVAQGCEALGIQAAAWPLLNPLRAESRRQTAALFALEELQLHLRENENKAFTRTGTGLGLIVHELGLWTNIGAQRVG